MTYRILTTRPDATLAIPGGHIRPDYAAVVLDEENDRATVVTFSERANQVRRGAAVASPAYSDKAIDYVAEWYSSKQAQAHYDRARKKAKANADLAAELRRGGL